MPNQDLVAKIISFAALCIRCHSKDLIAYGGGYRRYCRECGLSFHIDSTDEQDEMIRRMAVTRA